MNLREINFDIYKDYPHLLCEIYNNHISYNSICYCKLCKIIREVIQYCYNTPTDTRTVGEILQEKIDCKTLYKQMTKQNELT